MKIACLHTADSNIKIYEDAARQLGLPPGALYHHVRADLLLTAERLGGLTTDIVTETADVLQRLARDADAVIFNCSTLGPASSQAATAAAVPIIRADGVLADEAVKAGGKVIVFCTVETTIGPTTSLFEAAAKATGAEIDVRLIPGAWALFRAGNRQAYLASIAKSVEATHEEGPVTVVFAQASMTDAARLLPETRVRPLSGPTAVLAAAMSRIAAV
ncbi:Asp/Glu racemase [Rhizobium tropici]|uniref:Asp/Glu racemase n=1 Tax=Rhizobium tropici TaxID=398 RepID=A0A5B0VVU3_RHITR|nr:aspartate/glutamate racemase family protein [Rhizobium tropici]KAA1178051.1 Asp/Glu racemase [Rhizobium tropici]